MKTRTWLATWGSIAGITAGYLVFTLRASDRALLVPGEATAGHHTIESRCEACHSPFKGADQDKCLRCHGERMSEENDSHAAGKFSDPRNADRLKAMDVRLCVTCHREHVPGSASATGVTVPRDFCARCHQDIGKDRPDHARFAFDRCADAGCHNYHDNRALNADFIAKHLGEPDLLATRVVSARPALAPAALATPDAPADVHASDAVHDWERSAHARAGVSCSGCHQPGGAPWTDAVKLETCRGCHADEAKGFLSGVHGMRTSLGMPPLTPAMARLPMRGSAGHVELGCNACHGAHAFDTRAAAVDACLLCHDDRHSVAYARSPHSAAWKAEAQGALPAGSGVSCATCHMPRVGVEAASAGGAGRVLVEHDQSANLQPNVKQARDACLRCHGLAFTLDALADPDLVSRNFAGAPQRHVESLSMVNQRGADR
jgi:hypothetical protein